jgi:hypothetical protein
MRSDEDISDPRAKAENSQNTVKKKTRQLARSAVSKKM